MYGFILQEDVRGEIIVILYMILIIKKILRKTNAKDISRILRKYKENVQSTRKQNLKKTMSTKMQPNGRLFV